MSNPRQARWVGDEMELKPKDAKIGWPEGVEWAFIGGCFQWLTYDEWQAHLRGGRLGIAYNAAHGWKPPRIWSWPKLSDAEFRRQHGLPG